MKLMNVTDAIPPAGHYSMAVISHGLIFISGILPIHQQTGEKLTSASFQEQVIQVFSNLTAILNECGSDPGKLVKVNVYIKNVDDWLELNTLYKEFLGDHKPARTVIPVSHLHYGFLIELDAIAEM